MYDEFNPNNNEKKKKVSPWTIALTSFSVLALIVSSVSLNKVSKIAKQDTVKNQVGINVVSESSGSGNTNVSTSTNGVVSVAQATKNKVVLVSVYGKTSGISNNISYGQISSGSGFVVTQDGYIVTNYHVIDGGSSFKVSFSSEEQYDAQLVGGDSYSDIAVLKINSDKQFDPITIGDSSKVQVGEIAIAIGSPLGSQLTNSVTVGYISATDREITNDGHTTKMIQTDAAINPGNSGGPLINANGNVIGINTMKSTFAGYDSYGNAVSADGISFAIPISDAMPVITQIIETGKYERPGIGISYYTIDEETAKKSNISQGLLISKVYSDSPASKAGLKVDDIIVAVDDTETKTSEQLNDYINSKKVGDKVKIKYIRSGQEKTTELTLGDINTINTSEQNNTNSNGGSNWVWPF